MLNKQNNLIKALLLGSVFLFYSCDFTSPIRKKILAAQSLILSKQYKQAISKYKNILNEKPPLEVSIKIYYQIGEIYSLHLSKFKEAVVYFNKVKKLSADPVWLVKSEEKLAEINYFFLKNYDASYESYKRLAQFKPKLEKNDEFEIMMARSLLNLNHYGKARLAFEAISLNKKHKYYSRSIFYLGKISFFNKDWKQAIIHWLEYIKTETNNNYIVEAKFFMANAYESLEELRKAYNIYYSLMGEYPNTEIIKKRLDSVYERRIARKR